MASEAVTITGAETMVGYLITPPFSTSDVYTFSFKYLDQADFEITVQTETVLDADDYEFTSEYLIQLTSTGVDKLEALYGALDEVGMLIRRRTKIDGRLVDFIDNSTLKESDLDLQSDQLFYLIQEAYDEALIGSSKLDPVTGIIDIAGAEMADIGDPTTQTSAVNLRTLLNNVVTPDYTAGEIYRSKRLVFYGGDLYRSNKDIGAAPASFNAADWDLIIDASELAKISTLESGIATNVADIAALDSAKFDKTGGTISSDVIIEGNLTVEGLTTTVNSDTLDVTDANVTVNKGGTQVSADMQDAGITVEMSDATDAKVGYDSTVESKFKVGEVGSESEVITADHTQSMTNKTLVSPSIQTPSRLDVKQDTQANLETYASTAADGQFVFATDTKKMYQIIDNALTDVGGGSGGLSTYHTNDAESSDASEFDCLDGGVIGSGALISTFVSIESTNPLNGSQSFKFTIPASGTGKYCLIDASSLIPVPLYAQNGISSFSFVAGGTFAKNDFSLFLWDATAGATVKNADGNTAFISPRENIANVLRFATSGTENLQWGVYINTDNTGATLIVDNVEFEANPDKNISIFASSNTKQYAPIASSGGGGAISFDTGSGYVAPNATWYRSGQTMLVNGTLRNGSGGTISGTAGDIEISLPSGYTIKSDDLPDPVGGLIRIGAGEFFSPEDPLIVSYYSPTTVKLYSTLNSRFLTLADIGPADLIVFDFDVPIQGWSDKEPNVAVANTDQAFDRKVFYRNTSVQSIPNTTNTTILLNGAKSENVGNRVTYNSGTGVFNVSESGFYDLMFNATYETIANTGYRYVNIYNATDAITLVSVGRRVQASEETSLTAGKTIYLEAGKDYSFRAYQDSGVAVNMRFGESITYLSINYNPSFREVVSAYLQESNNRVSDGTEYMTTDSIDGKPVYERVYKTVSDITSITTIDTIDTGLNLVNAIGIDSDDFIIKSFPLSGTDFSLIAYKPSTGVIRGDAGGSYTLPAGTTFRIRYTK